MTGRRPTSYPIREIRVIRGFNKKQGAVSVIDTAPYLNPIKKGYFLMLRRVRRTLLPFCP